MKTVYGLPRFTKKRWVFWGEEGQRTNRLQSALIVWPRSSVYFTLCLRLIGRFYRIRLMLDGLRPRVEFVVSAR
jgi:hypothetical protein